MVTCVAQGVGDVSKFLSILKQILEDNFLQNWNDRIAESSRASFYKEVCIFQFQKYLDQLKNLLKN